MIGPFSFMAGRISIGAFYNPHLAEAILASDLITHLAVADSPGPHDRWWPQIHRRFTLLLHDYLGQLSEPLSPEELSRAKRLIEEYRSPWAAEHVQRIRRDENDDPPVDCTYTLDYVFPPLYTQDLLDAYLCNARSLREHLGVPLALEPIPTYLHLDVPQIEEAEFMHRLCHGSGCHLLLDIPHAILSAHSQGREARSLLEDLPLDRVIEIHVAGLAHDVDLGESWVAPILPDRMVLDLAEFAAARAPALRAITFDAFSPTLTAKTLTAGVRMLHERFGAY